MFHVPLQHRFLGGNHMNWTHEEQAWKDIESQHSLHVLTLNSEIMVGILT